MSNSKISESDLVARFSYTGIDRDSAPFYEALLNRRLVMSYCRDCSSWDSEHRSMCAKCHSTNVGPREVSGDGSVFLATFLHQGPAAEGVEYDPSHPVVTVTLDEADDLRFTSGLYGAPPEDVQIGCRVRLDWVMRNGHPVPVFRLAEVAQ